MANQAADRVVVCEAGGRRFSLDVTAVREVCTGISPVRVPGVAAPVEGVANVRGTLVTIVRAAELLGVEAGISNRPSPWLVVLRARDGRVGLGVDDVLDLEAVDSSVPRLDVDGALEPLFARLG